MIHNPYQSPEQATEQSPESSAAEVASTIPPTQSIRLEAYRGFKFGARLMAILMSVLVGLVAFGMLGMAVYLTVRTNGVFFTEIRYFEIVKGIGGVILFVLLMSFYGGLAGGMLMAIAAVLRKRRHQQALAQDSDA